jgi:hypothetical protein
MQELIPLLVFVTIFVLLGAVLTVVVVRIFRVCEDTPDPRNVPGREMKAVGRAVVALLEQTDKSDLTFQKLTFLKIKLLG